MSNFFKIPVTPEPQQFFISLAGIRYKLRLEYANTDQGGWYLDILDFNSVPILQGIPLVTGVNLLGPYDYLAFGGAIYVQTANNPDAVPTFLNLGVDALLYWVTK